MEDMPHVMQIYRPYSVTEMSRLFFYLLASGTDENQAAEVC